MEAKIETKSNEKNGLEMDIPTLSEAVVRRQVNVILDKSIPAPKPFFARVKEVYLGPGLYSVFYNSETTILTSLFLYGVFLFVAFLMRDSVKYNEYLVLMLFPILHLLFLILAYWSEEQAEMVELKRSLMYSFTYIISLRMLYLSIVSAIFNLIVLSVVFSMQNVGKIGLLGVSSVFLFATISIYLCEKMKSYYQIIVMTVIWCSLCLLLSKSGANLNYFLFDVLPLAVHGIIALICFAGFISFIRRVELKNAYTYEY